MSSVDSRIVTMKFDNAQFERGVTTSMATIQRLKSSLDFSGSTGKATSGLAGLNRGIKSLDMSPVSTSIDGASGKFVAMASVGVAAFATLAHKAIEVGAGMARNVTQPLMDGFSDYELKIGATQTIMAGTGKGIGVVSKYLKELDVYADQTIYSLSDMTSNIGKFTNAGVKLPVAVNAMKGVANVAALSGANSNEAARAMYNFGQAIGQGSVKLMDWKSIELANMGTKEFKQQLIDSAVASGSLTKGLNGVTKTSKGTIVNTKNFSTTLSEAWLTSKALTNTLGDYADKSTDIGKRAYAAAQDVKTFSMMTETLKAAAGTGWTDTFEIVLGNLPEATKVFTALTNVFGKMIASSANARNSMLQDWKKLGGRTDLIKGISNAWHALVGVVKPIRDAFREIFPKTTGKELADMTARFREFTEGLIPSKKTAENIKKTFKGFFAVLSIGLAIIKGVIGYFLGWIPLLAGGNGSILNITGSIGDLLVKLQEWLVGGERISGFFDKLSEARAKVFGPIISVLYKVAGALAYVVSGAVMKAFEWLVDNWGRLSDLANALKEAAQDAFGSMVAYITPVLHQLGAFGDILGSFLTGGVTAGMEAIESAFANLGSVASNIGNSLKQGLSNIDLGSIFDIGDKTSVAQAGIEGVKGSLHGVASQGDRVRAAWEATVAAFQGFAEFLAPVVEVIKNIFAGIKDKLMNFVSGMGIEDGLAVVNTGFFIAFYSMARKFVSKLGGVVDSLKGVLDQTTKSLKTMQADVKANAILKIAGALALLAVALWVLSKIPLDRLAQSLGAIGILLIMVSKALTKLEDVTSGMKDAVELSIVAGAMVALGLALVAFAGAIAILGNMKPKTLITGLAAVAAILLVIVGITALLTATGGGAALVAAAIAIGILAVSMTVFAGAIKLFSALEPGMLANGVLKIALCLIALGLALAVFPPTVLATAAGILVLSFALGILIPALVMIAAVDWSTIISALLKLALVFGALALMSVLLAPIIPIMLALSATILILGAAMLLAGAGMWLFATAIAALAVSGTAGFAVLMAGIMGFVQAFPLIMQQIGLGIRAFAKVLAESGPPLARAFATVLISLANAIKKATPAIGRMLVTLINTGLRVIRQTFPNFLKTGIQIIMNLLTGIRNNIGKITKVSTDIVVKFLGALGRQIPRITAAGFKFIIKFLNGTAKAIRENDDAMIKAGGNLARAILSGMGKALYKGGTYIKNAAISIAKNALKGAMSWLGIKSPSKKFMEVGKYSVEGLALGLERYSSLSEGAAAGVAESAMDSVKSSMQSMSDIVSGDIDMNPVIAPVLDLTALTQEANKMPAILATDALVAGVSFDQASSISAEQMAAQDAALQAASETTPSEPIKFEQNNYSPKALDPVTIYRNTKSQIALAKEELKT